MSNSIHVSNVNSLKVQSVMFYCLFAQNGHNSWVGAHKSVESAASACITSNVCILFLSLCSIFHLLYFLTLDYCNVPVSPWGPHKFLLIFAGKTWKNATRRHTDTGRDRSRGWVTMWRVVALLRDSLSISPLVYSSITSCLSLWYCRAQCGAAPMVQKWESGVKEVGASCKRGRTRQCFGNWLFM